MLNRIIEKHKEIVKTNTKRITEIAKSLYSDGLQMVFENLEESYKSPYLLETPPFDVWCNCYDDTIRIEFRFKPDLHVNIRRKFESLLSRDGFKKFEGTISETYTSVWFYEHTVEEEE